MAQVVVAVDYSKVKEYEYNQMVVQWFIDKGIKIKDDSFSSGDDTLKYNNYEKFNVVIFNFDNQDGDYFSPLLYNYLGLGVPQDIRKKVKISLAEEGNIGFVTLVETNLNKFLEMLNSSDDGEE